MRKYIQNVALLRNSKLIWINHIMQDEVQYPLVSGKKKEKWTFGSHGWILQIRDSNTACVIMKNSYKCESLATLIGKPVYL